MSDERAAEIAAWATTFMESLQAEVAASSHVMLIEYAGQVDLHPNEIEEDIFTAGVHAGLACTMTALMQRKWLAPPPGETP